MIYFEIPNFIIKRIYLIKENNKLVYKKLVDNVYVSLTSEEEAEVNKYLNRNRSNIYYTEKLNTIIENNPSLNVFDNDYLKKFLEYIEANIPISALDNFYNNLKTLKLELNLEVLNEPIVEDIPNENFVGANYSIENNALTINKDNIRVYRKIAAEANKSEDWFWKNFNHDLIHELFHVASSKKVNNRYISGFDFYPSNFSFEENRGLTEGFTEVLACAAIPTDIEMAGGYYIEELLVNQLMSVIGPNVMINSYFNNLGIQEMAEKLCELDSDFDEALILFNLIEINFSLDKNVQSSILSHIEMRILNYFKLKIKNDILHGVKEEEIIRQIDTYKKYLVTSEIVNIRKESMAKYDGIEGVLDKFMQFENEIKEQLASRKV